jgi:Methyltransferase domain
MQEEEAPDAEWVRALSGRSLAASRRAVEEAAQQRRLFDHIAREHRSEGRRSYVEIDAPLELHALVRLLRPRHVVEVGVSSGVSSAYLLHALDMNGRGTLHSVDLPQRPAKRRPGQGPTLFSWTLPPGRSPGWAVPFALRGRWDLRLGDKAKVLPLLAAELPRIDLFVYDVPHRDESTRGEFRLLAPLLAPGGVAIADHGPGGELCPALRGWATSVGGTATGRDGLGLYGFRRPSRRSRVRRRRGGAASAAARSGARAPAAGPAVPGPGCVS